jgi:hypothetical protein
MIEKQEQQRLDAEKNQDSGVFADFSQAFLYWIEHGGQLFASVSEQGDPPRECWVVATSQRGADLKLLRNTGATFVRRITRKEAQRIVVELAQGRTSSGKGLTEER